MYIFGKIIITQCVISLTKNTYTMQKELSKLIKKILIIGLLIFLGLLLFYAVSN